MKTIRFCSTLLGASGFATVLFVVLPCVAVGGDAPSPPRPPISPDTGIVVTVQGTEQAGYSLTIQPKVALLRAGDPLTLSVPYMNGLHVDVEFVVMNGTKGPFPVDSSSPDNPVKGRYTNKGTGHTSITTQPSGEQARDTLWKYEVVLRNAQDVEKAVSDPSVIFK